jgi:predicted transcriptional regulator of viral defense system
MPTRTKTEALIRLAKAGPIRPRDLAAAGIPRSYLGRLVSRGVLEQTARGVYQRVNADVTELHSLAEVALRVPHGIVCLLSALQVHGLTTELPHAVWLMIDQKARAPAEGSPKLELVRASGDARTHGVEVRRIEAVDVKITSAAKTVADCFRYRRRVGLEVALEALRAYLRPPRRAARSIDALVAAARADRVTSVVRPYLEALA